MYKKLKNAVYAANQSLPKYGLVTLTWGNASQIDREKGVVAIKPSGVEYKEMKTEDIVIVDLDGNVLEGDLKPSSDLMTHLQFYKSWPNIGGVVHTHSPWATSWAQAGKSIPTLGTTHADYFNGPIPCTRKLTKTEINDDYELETGRVIVETFESINHMEVPGALVISHGPFTWGKNAKESVQNAVVLEELAKMAAITNTILEQETKPLQKELLKKHFQRKHGDGSYYGQE